MKHHFVAFLIGVSVPITFSNCMTASAVIYGLDQQIASLRISLAREQQLSRKLADEAEALKLEISRNGPSPQRIERQRQVEKERRANEAEKAKIEQEIRRLERAAGTGG